MPRCAVWICINAINFQESVRLCACIHKQQVHFGLINDSWVKCDKIYSSFKYTTVLLHFSGNQIELSFTYNFDVKEVRPGNRKTTNCIIFKTRIWIMNFQKVLCSTYELNDLLVLLLALECIVSNLYPLFAVYWCPIYVYIYIFYLSSNTENFNVLLLGILIEIVLFFYIFQEEGRIWGMWFKIGLSKFFAHCTSFSMIGNHFWLLLIWFTIDFSLSLSIQTSYDRNNKLPKD